MKHITIDNESKACHHSSAAAYLSYTEDSSHIPFEEFSEQHRCHSIRSMGKNILQEISACFEDFRFVSSTNLPSITMLPKLTLWSIRFIHEFITCIPGTAVV